MKKNLVKCICFFAIFAVLFAYITSVFEFKYGDGIYGVKKYYELENNTVDLLILGSSHAFENFNTSVLWKDYGIAAYDFCGSMQPLWNTYYYLKEALKTQTPKMIVLEGYMLTYESEYSDNSRIIKNNYGLKWSIDKIKSLKVSVPEEEYFDFLLPYSQYHTRYNELSRSDFLIDQGNPFFENWKGFGNNMETNAYDKPNISEIMEKTEISDKSQLYYEKILNLAKQKNIPIIVVIAPYAGISIEDEKKFNMASSIANNMDVPFYNFNMNYDDMDLDFTTDIADGDHLNYLGNVKFTQYFGNLMCREYEANYIDRRENEKYSSWQLSSQYYDRLLLNNQISKCQSAGELFEMASDADYEIFLSISKSDQLVDSLYDYLENKNINLERRMGAWRICDGCITYNMQLDNMSYYEQLSDYDDLMIYSRDQLDGKSLYEIWVNNVNYTSVIDGINILVYDKITQSIVTTMGF